MCLAFFFVLLRRTAVDASHIKHSTCNHLNWRLLQSQVRPWRLRIMETCHENRAFTILVALNLIYAKIAATVVPALIYTQATIATEILCTLTYDCTTDLVTIHLWAGWNTHETLPLRCRNLWSHLYFLFSRELHRNSCRDQKEGSKKIECW